MENLINNYNELKKIITFNAKEIGVALTDLVPVEKDEYTYSYINEKGETKIVNLVENEKHYILADEETDQRITIDYRSGFRFFNNDVINRNWYKYSYDEIDNGYKQTILLNGNQDFNFDVRIEDQVSHGEESIIFMLFNKVTNTYEKTIRIILRSDNKIKSKNNLEELNILNEVILNYINNVNDLLNTTAGEYVKKRVVK